MFLNRLNPNEKEAFLQLAHHVARIDGEFSKEEEFVIAQYCMEMQMDDIEYNELNFDLSKALNNFETPSHCKVALLEIMSMIYADGVLHQTEEALITNIINHFDLNPHLAIVYREWSKSILALFVQGEALLHL